MSFLFNGQGSSGAKPCANSNLIQVNWEDMHRIFKICIIMHMHIISLLAVICIKKVDLPESWYKINV